MSLKVATVYLNDLEIEIPYFSLSPVLLETFLSRYAQCSSPFSAGIRRIDISAMTFVSLCSQFEFMYIEQLYTSCLAEAAYYIESDGEAAIIDPIRETSPYTELASKRNTKIKFVFETHFHADFVSGHIDLARITGAKIVFGPKADTAYNTYQAKDGEEFKIGSLTIRVIHTPGHTPESTCYLLSDESGNAKAIFTGDTLFVGDVGRPDLLDGKMTKEELASMMYDSLNNKIKPLADDIIVYPAHGPGSSCGKNIGKETWSTIGEQKRSNYALQEMSQEEFVKVITGGLLPPPAYFFADAGINKNGYSDIETVVNDGLKALSPVEFESKITTAQILDTRKGIEFETGFIAGSINIGLDGRFAIWVGTVMDIHTPLLLICEEGKEKETVTRLARVGFEKVLGYLNGGIRSWISSGKTIETLESITPAEFSRRYKNDAEILDVRKISEAEGGHFPNATVLPLEELRQNIAVVSSMEKANEPVYIHCAHGYRSLIAASILKKEGIQNVVNLKEGWSRLKDAGLPVKKGPVNGVEVER